MIPVFLSNSVTLVSTSGIFIVFLILANQSSTVPFFALLSSKVSSKHFKMMLRLPSRQR